MLSFALCNIAKYVPRKDYKAASADLKSATEDEALLILDQPAEFPPNNQIIISFAPF